MGAARTHHGTQPCWRRSCRRWCGSRRWRAAAARATPTRRRPPPRAPPGQAARGQGCRVISCTRIPSLKLLPHTYSCTINLSVSKQIQRMSHDDQCSHALKSGEAEMYAMRTSCITMPFSHWQYVYTVSMHASACRPAGSGPAQRRRCCRVRPAHPCRSRRCQSQAPPHGRRQLQPARRPPWGPCAMTLRLSASPADSQRHSRPAFGFYFSNTANFTAILSMHGNCSQADTVHFMHMQFFFHTISQNLGVQMLPVRPGMLRPDPNPTGARGPVWHA